MIEGRQLGQQLRGLIEAKAKICPSPERRRIVRERQWGWGEMKCSHSQAALLWNLAEVVSSATSCSFYSRATGKVGLMDEFRTGSSTCPSPDDPIRRRGQLASLVEVLEAFRDSRIELFE